MKLDSKIKKRKKLLTPLDLFTDYEYLNDIGDRWLPFGDRE